MKEEKKASVLYLMTFLVVLAIIATSLLVYKVMDDFGYFFPNSRENMGLLGDFLGGILNPFFAFLGLIMLLVTLYQNQKEIHFSRMELKASNEALRSQAGIAAKQRFEDTFFSLLKLHNDKVETLVSDGLDSKVEGLNNSVIGCGSYMTSIGYNVGKDNSVETASIEIETAYGESFGSYFKMVVSILNFIAVNSKSEAGGVNLDEGFYADLFKSHVPKAIIPLLLVYSASNTKTAVVLRPLVKRYFLLEGYTLAPEKRLNLKLLNDSMKAYNVEDFGESGVSYTSFAENINDLLLNVGNDNPWELARKSTHKISNP